MARIPLAYSLAFSSVAYLDFHNTFNTFKCRLSKKMPFV